MKTKFISLLAIILGLIVIILGMTQTLLTCNRSNIGYIPGIDTAVVKYLFNIQSFISWSNIRTDPVYCRNNIDCCWTCYINQ